MAIALAFCGAMVSSPSSANPFKYTEAQREACIPEALRLCEKYVPDAESHIGCPRGYWRICAEFVLEADGVPACLTKNWSRLSRRCRAVWPNQ
jgi:hypothetical protein